MTVEQQPETAQTTAKADTVQLTYHAARDQIAETIRTRRRVSPGGRRRRVTTFVAAALWAVYIVLAAVNGAVIEGSLPLLIVAVGVCALVILLRALAVGNVSKLKQRKGEHRITVNGQGVSVATDLNTARVPWAHLKGYAEADNLFVLVHTGMHEINTTPLPKSALPQQGDVERLRGLLDRHTTRMGGTPRS